MPLKKSLDVGDSIPDFELLDQNGKWVKRADFEAALVIFLP